MLRPLYSCALMSAALLSSGGCSNDCETYKAIVRSDEDQAKLIDWADGEIFSRTFEMDDFEKVPGFVGPGKGGANFDLSHTDIEIPALLSGYTIRSVGPDRYHPEVILVGKRRYQGILITRGSLDESLRRTTMDRQRVEESKERVAMICYTEV